MALEPTARAGGPTRSVLRFEVVDPTAALARAGFKTGDELVALNGSTQQLYQVPELLRVATPQGGSVTLSIRRGTETLQLKLDLGVAVPSSEAGGQLRLVRLKRGQE